MNTFESENLTGQNHGGAKENTPLKVLTATSLIGNEVENLQGETIGEVHDLMINVHSGEVDYAIIEHGGFLGLGQKLFAVPFKQLELDTVKEVYILDKSLEFFEKAPGFDRDHWPETNSHLYEETNTYWGSFMGVNTGGAR